MLLNSDIISIILGVESMNMNQVRRKKFGIKGLYMNPRKAPVIYDPDTSNYIE